jgi:hypothetical protein
VVGLQSELDMLGASHFKVHLVTKFCLTRSCSTASPNPRQLLDYEATVAIARSNSERIWFPPWLRQSLIN